MSIARIRRLVCLCTAAAALCGCSEVDRIRQTAASSFHESFRTSLRSSFMRSCTANGTSAKHCDCVEVTMEEKFTDDQLVEMSRADHGQVGELGAACTAQDDVAPAGEAIAAALPADDPSPIAIYITPYYNSSGPVVEVGPFSRGLASKDEHTFVDTILKMKSAWSKLSFPELYVGAIRLYDFGYRQEAVYWFYSAQYRGRLFSMLIDQHKMGGIGDPGFELFHAQDAFFQLSGPTINGYAFGHLDALSGIVRRVQSENRAVPDVGAIYPNVRFTDKAGWAANNKQLNEGLSELISSLASQKETIKQQRASNGTEAEYGKLTSKNLPAKP